MDDFRKYVYREIRSSYPAHFADIMAQTDRHYGAVSKDTAFALTSGNPLDRRLELSAYFLALIMTLHEKGESVDRIRSLCLQIVTAYVQPKHKLQAFAKRLVPRLIPTWLGQRLLRAFHRKVSVNPNPAGFVANIITDKQQTYGLGYGFDILECGICHLFRKHGYAEYASILCEVDKITSAMAGLSLIRSGTIANGATKCDFRFQRVR